MICFAEIVQNLYFCEEVSGRMAISPKMERRTSAFGLIIISIVFILVARLAYLQFSQGEKFMEMAEDNRINYQTIGAPRGKIFTTDGEVLVTNKMAYSASIKLKELRSIENIETMLAGLTTLLNLERADLIQSILKITVDGKVILMDEITSQEKIILEENLKQLPGMTIQKKVDSKGNLIKEYLQVDLKKVSTLNLMRACEKLSELFSIKYEDLILQIIAKGSKNQSTLRVKRNLTQVEMVVLEEKLQDLPGVIVERVSIRDYVYGPLASHTLGYVGAISAEELQAFGEKGYRGDDYVGKTGLERYYEDYLRGQDGREQIEVDSWSRKVRTLGIHSPLPGANLYVNFDLKLQAKVEEVLEQTLNDLREKAENDPKSKGGPKGGAVIVMDPSNGKILAMTSKPNFDLNLFAGGISVEDLHQLSNDPYDPFTNRAISFDQPPGSIFKLVSAGMMLEEGLINKDTIVHDKDGRYWIGQWKYDNWARKSRGGSGDLTIEDAIAESNNVFFYKIAHDLYKREYSKNGSAGTGLVQAEYARAFGLGQKTGIDLPLEKEGVVPDAEWARQVHNSIWLPGYSVLMSIGQWDLRTTPLQLINYLSAVANGGKLYRPTVVDRVESYDGMLIKKNEPEVIGQLPVSKKNLEIIKSGMVAVTTRGTAKKYFEDIPIKVAGKTGTAQTDTNKANQGWFAGFAPADKPQIAILVFLEDGESSSYTLPIVTEILRYYFDLPEPVDPDAEEGQEEQDGVDTDATNIEIESETESLESAEEITSEEEEETITDNLRDFFKEVFSTP